ncbi:MAG TPA: four helix bundle protein [Gemmatimonadales bacterium]
MIASVSLEAWRATHQLVLAVFDATSRFPIEERFGLRTQLRGAAVSLAAHVARASSHRTQRHDHASARRGWAVVAQLGVLLQQARQRRLLDQAVWHALEDHRRAAARHVWRLPWRPPLPAGRTVPRADGQGRWALDVRTPATTP